MELEKELSLAAMAVLFSISRIKLTKRKLVDLCDSNSQKIHTESNLINRIELLG